VQRGKRERKKKGGAMTESPSLVNKKEKGKKPEKSRVAPASQIGKRETGARKEKKSKTSSLFLDSQEKKGESG